MSGNSPVFVLLTDFGLDDPYAGQLKAALYARAVRAHPRPFPRRAAVRRCHGAFFLAASRGYYPPGAIFICVVDPGVGSGRAVLCIQGKNHTVLGPDNGLLALAYRDMLREGPVSVYTLTAPGAVSANTFHGRDILAPAAASLALGRDASRLGAPARTAPAIPAWAAAERGEGEILCTVLHVDRFGNCILNLPNAEETLLYPRLSLRIPKTGKTVALRQAGHYAELPSGVPGILPGGQGYYEIAMANAPAGAFLGLSPGDACRILGEFWSRS